LEKGESSVNSAEEIGSPHAENEARSLKPVLKNSKWFDTEM
jgi:hypothetical protein